MTILYINKTVKPQYSIWQQAQALSLPRRMGSSKETSKKQDNRFD
jgi:hypothetical protein